MSTQTIDHYATLLGAIFGIVGLFISTIQALRIKSLKYSNRKTLELMIADANYVSLEHELLDEIAPMLKNSMLFRYLVSAHQRGCDLYRHMLDYYLSNIDNFAYEELEAMCGYKMITYRWQEEYWRSRLVLRPENKGKVLPADAFLKQDRPSRFKAFGARTP